MEEKKKYLLCSAKGNFAKHKLTYLGEIKDFTRLFRISLSFSSFVLFFTQLSVNA